MPTLWMKRILFFPYWLAMRIFRKIEVREFSVSPRIVIEPHAMIRYGSYVYGSLRLGKYSYISGPGTLVFDAEIGRFCSIARDVYIGMPDHATDFVSTHPCAVSSRYGLCTRDVPIRQKERPRIGHDVWIGARAIICRGVVIGNGAVIAAGAVVTKDVAPYSIAGGVPAKHIRYRFEPEIIERLQMLQWWNFPEKELMELMPFFSCPEKFIQECLSRKKAVKENC